MPFHRIVRSFLVLPVVLAAASGSDGTMRCCHAESPTLLRMFGKRDAAPVQRSTYELDEEAGPFLILAATLVGEDSKVRAEALAGELRESLKLPTYVFEEDFDFTKTVSFDPRTARRTRYANSYRYEAHAVLIGEYDSVSHPGIEADLERIKRAKPKVLDDPDTVAAETDRSTPVTTLKGITRRILSVAQSQGKDFGPMAHAFVTRNPLLPADYFSAPPIDDFVENLNEGLPHSLLDCEGKYTVVVKTFRGAETLVDARKSSPQSASRPRFTRMQRDAEKMVKDLRDRGVEAYQYHDRHRSLVTIGSFDGLGQELPGGKFQYEPAIREIMTRYSALNVRPELARQIPGNAKGMAANAAALIPFDVQPTPIAIPKPGNQLGKRPLYGRR